MLTTMADEPIDHLFSLLTAADWHARMMADGFLPFWVVFYNSTRYPHVFHARAWTVPAHGNGGMINPTAYAAILVAPTIEAIRALLPDGVIWMERVRDDPWDLVERWMS